MKLKLWPRFSGERYPGERPLRRGMSALAIGLTGLCAGCVSTPLPDLQVAVPRQWQHAPSSAATSVPGAAAGTWWHAFADTRLDAVVDEALAVNLDVGQAAARLRAARALHRVAGAQFRPNLGLRTSDPIDPDASASYLVAGFDSIWELGLFGRSQAAHRIARGEVDTAQADLRDAQVSVAAEVSRQWIMLRAAQRRESFLTHIRDMRVEQAALTDERLRLRIASPQQSAQARAAVAQVEAALAEPREAAASAAQALAVLLGRSEPDPAWMQPGALPELHELRVTSAPADLLRIRPDIARGQAAVLSAAGELGIAKADRYPNLAIGGSIVVSTSEAERRTTDTGIIGSIGPIIEIPLFDWGMRRAKAEAKAEDLHAAALAYRKTVLTAVAEVESALAALDQQRLRESASVQALQAYDEIADRSARRERLGLASGLDIAASNTDREQAALEVDAARTSRALDYIALCKALGGNPQIPPIAATDEVH